MRRATPLAQPIACRSTAVDYQRVRLHEPYEEALVRFLLALQVSI